jgi:PAS domain S-box-containing protein
MKGTTSFRFGCLLALALALAAAGASSAAVPVPAALAETVHEVPAAFLGGRNWLPWLLGSLGVGGLLVGLVVFINVRLQRTVDERTRALREVEDRWLLAVRGINDGIWDASLVKDEIFLSDRCFEMLGFQPDEIKPSRSDWLARIHPADVPVRERAMAEHVAGRTSHYDVEFRMRHKDGSYRWLRSRGQALFDAQGRAVRAVGSHTDIHARRVAEYALRDSEERFRTLFESAVEGIYESSPDEDCLRSANPALARMLGYETSAQLTEAKLAIEGGLYVKQGRRREFIRAIGQLNNLVDFESEVRRRDGRTIWVKENVHVVRGADGRIESLQGFVSDVTERRRAEAALRESETRFRMLFEQSPVALLEHDYTAVERWFQELRAAGVRDLEAHLATHPELVPVALSKVGLTGTNEAAVRLLGADSSAHLIEHLDHVMTSDSRRARLANLCTLWRGGNQNEGEISLRRFDGADRRLFFRWWMPMSDGRLNFRGAQTVFIDITGIRHAEEALRASEERYRVLFEHSPVAIIEQDYRRAGAWLETLRNAGITDLERYFQEHPEELVAAMQKVSVADVNEETVRLLRGPSRQHVIENMGATFTPEVYEARREAFVAIWEGRNEIEGELTVRAFDGTPVATYYRWWLPRLHGKPNFAWTQVVLVDLTDIKRTEAALAAERERLTVTLRSMTEGVIATDTDGVVQYVNNAVGEMTGWTPGVATGRRIGEICVLRQERTNAPVTLPFTEALIGGQATELPAQTLIMHRQGSMRLIEGRCAPMHDLAGSVIGAVVVFRDITERSRLEEELRRSSKLESVGVLAGGIAHDFNNILTVVMGNLALAMLDASVQAAAGKWLREAERGTMRARDLTQQLLTFAKGGDPVRTAVSLPEVIEEAAQFALHGSKVRCEFSLAVDASPADIDKGQIGQVVQNLVINAVQAMPEGGVIRIALCNETVAAGQRPPLTAGSYLKISISDSGTGIRPEHLSRIFDPYFTTKQQGSGLGLATVYSIVRKHDGHVDVESELGRGTTFLIWLPAARGPAPATPGTSNPFGGIKGRVLFMDDEEPIRLMAEVLLGRLGLSATIVSDGTEAVQAYTRAKAEGKPFDAVIMDLTVPGGMGGKETMEALLAIDPEVKAIVSSGYSSDPIMANYRAHGFRGRVAKPYRMADLAKTLKTVLGDKVDVENL